MAATFTEAPAVVHDPWFRPGERRLAHGHSTCAEPARSATLARTDETAAARFPVLSDAGRLVAWSTFTLSPRLVLSSGLIIIATWSVGIGIVALQPETPLGFGLPGPGPAALARYLDPAFIDIAAWATGVFTACLITGILAVVVHRTHRLVAAQACVERARDNLARHVSANLVDELAELDEPFGPARIQDAAILFADVIGFTSLCEGRSPQAVMAMLRGFHERMADCVFEAGGTLDKFVGDSVMATFGTPKPSRRDATNALTCARKMLACLDAWNTERRAQGEPVLKIGIGLHFGPVVLGTIGHERRVEYAVLGDTVNTASRLEALSRDLQTSLVSSHALIEKVRAEVGEHTVRGMHRHPPVVVRGRMQAMEVWILVEHGCKPRLPLFEAESATTS
ncbi:adenylate/guanylate cyclase domain-containing protein [Methylobacterium sp. NEAU K]|uniref:adenylate/guanylate cyclase domain-containing protein n=1 Tax=Methylobacterium sp. NEAU K TaxID=3064946 RepID=UPI00273298F9|nr:adenylate/guanylate cyclase domain-containing protein [Methylobacterium sp. NEAU K]MDP4006593.1 adenylate/guanylate cyclase domain-containing protein [Methylobacterium sp. NEAU K]